jgi:zinc/manganese transport system substrate-binding protein
LKLQLGPIMVSEMDPRPVMRMMARVVAPCLLVTGMVACATSKPGVNASAGGGIQVVAAEDQWGSLASQLGGNLVTVTSIITNPSSDPHSYEPTAADARAFATAEIVIENGIGYDPWADQLLSANPVPGRLVINVGNVVGVQPGGNPHQWYSPTSVTQVIGTITADLERLDPKDTSTFEKLKHEVLTVSLAKYFSLLSQIKTSYSGTPVGASESIFEPMASALGLDLLTPSSFLKAISEGTEPTASDLATIDHQIASHQIALYVYNSQNATPDVARQVSECRTAGIPVTTITETLVPEGASFQQWQVSELRSLQTTLAKATGHR